jgi:hypothetical protein
MAASSFIQSNTTKGRVVKNASTNLTGLEGTLVSLNSGAGFATVTTTAAGARADFVLLEGGLSSTVAINEATNDLSLVSLLPLTSDQQIRVISTGTVSAGTEVQSDASGQAVPASTGNWVFGITEEAGVAGQYLLIRPVIYKK